METPDFDVVLIDTDSLIYSISWVHANQRAAEKALVVKLEEIIHNLEAPEAYVFVKGNDNFRHHVDCEYKANRLNSMDPEMADRVARLYSFAQDEFVMANGGEADDYCAIYSYGAYDSDKVPVVAHIDKDLNMIPGWHWNFKKGELYYTSPQDSFIAMCRQLLTGDYGDNIPGLKGVGPVTANQFLQNRFLHEMSDRIKEKWRDHYRSKGLGDWESRFYKSANCLILRESLDELRELSPEEIDKKISWSATNERYMDGITENIDMIANSQKITPYGAKRDKELMECIKTLDTGTGKGKASKKKTTLASSTSSKASSQTSTTSVKSPSTSTRKQKGLVAPTGKRTQGVVQS